MSSFDTNADFTIARLQAQLELSLKREAELEALLEEALELWRRGSLLKEKKLD